MRYVMFMIPAVYGTDDAEEMPSPEMVEVMMKYNADLAESGVMQSAAGLYPPSQGVRVSFGPQGSTVASIGTQDAVGGYWILDVESHEAAVEWARRCPAQPGDVLELRRIQEIEEFPQEVQDIVSEYGL